jgi:hypothetical protein
MEGSARGPMLFSSQPKYLVDLVGLVVLLGTSNFVSEPLLNVSCLTYRIQYITTNAENDIKASSPSAIIKLSIDQRE